MLNKTKTGLLLLGTLMTTSIINAQPHPIELPMGKQEGLDTFRCERPPRAGRDMRMPMHQGPNSGRITGHLFRKYDNDEDGELAGLELGNVTLDMVVQRPPLQRSQETGVLDLKAEAESLEKRLIRDFDIDESKGISVKEMIIALEAMRPPVDKVDKKKK